MGRAGIKPATLGLKAAARGLVGSRGIWVNPLLMPDSGLLEDLVSRGDSAPHVPTLFPPRGGCPPTQDARPIRRARGGPQALFVRVRASLTLRVLSPTSMRPLREPVPTLARGRLGHGFGGQGVSRARNGGCFSDLARMRRRPQARSE